MSLSQPESLFVIIFSPHVLLRKESETAEGSSLAEHRCETTTEAIKNSATFAWNLLLSNYKICFLA